MTDNTHIAKPTTSLGQSEGAYDINLQEIFQILKRRRQVIFGTIGVVVIFAILFLIMSTSQYTAKSLLIVNAAKSNVVDIESVVTGIGGNDAAIQSELDVLRSSTLAGRVVDKLNLTKDEEFIPQPGLIASLLSFMKDDKAEQDEEMLRRQSTIRTLQANLSINQKPRSYTIEIELTSTDAQKAALLANTYADEYLVAQLNSKFDETKRANEWLNEKLKDLQKRVRESELAAEAFREKHNLTETSAGTTLTDQQLSELNTHLILARTERAQAEARLGSAKDAINSSAEVLNSNLIQRLKEQEAEVLRKRSDLSNRYGSRHPKMVNVNAELRDLQSKIGLETKKIEQGLTNEVQVARTREKELAKSLRQLEGKAGISNKAEIQLSELTRQRDANRALYESFLARFKETTQNQDLQEADARIIAQADVPIRPSFPRKGLTLLLSLILGVGLGVVLAFVMEQLDNTFKSAEQLEKDTHTPSVGMVPELPAKTNIVEYASTKLSSIFAESMRSVFTSLHFSNPDHPPKIVMVTSTVPQEGKSSFCTSLATILAKAGHKVLLVDCDLKRPAVGKILGVKNSEFGLTELLAGDATQKQVIQLDKRSGLHFITSKPNTIHSQDVLGSKKMSAFLEKAASVYDMIILDTPPVMAVSDALVLSQKVDTTLFVVRWDKTPRAMVKAALKQMQACNVPLAGTILNRVNLEKHSRYGYADRGSYYGHYKEYYTQ